MGCRLDSQFIADQLCRFVRASLLASGADFDEHSSLAEAGIDSFSLVELLLYSERAFGIRVPESHLVHEHLASLSSLARCIAALGEKRASAAGTRS